MSRHGDTIWHLHRAVTRAGETLDRTTIREWCAGPKAPRSTTSLRVLERIEHRYRLPVGYFRSKLAHRGRATTRQAGSLLLKSSERRRIAWHLPDDFDQRPPKQRADIVEWVRNVIISGSTEYRRYQCKVLRDRFFASISEPHESVPLRPPCASFRDPAAKVLSATSSKERRGVWISRSGLAFS